MKRIFTILLVSLTYGVTAQVTFSEGINGRFVQVQDFSGRSLIKEKYDGDIEGSPFLNDDFTQADLLLNKGKELKKIMVNLNIESNELYIKDSVDRVLVIQDFIVNEITFANVSLSKSEKRIFRNGYPPVDKQSVNFFYEVLADGKIQLLKKISKAIGVIKNELSGEVRKEFTESIAYYILSGTEMENLRLQKEFILDLLKDKQPAVNEYIQTNKINLKKIPDVQKLITYYNTLK